MTAGGFCQSRTNSLNILCATGTRLLFFGTKSSDFFSASRLTVLGTSSSPAGTDLPRRDSLSVNPARSQSVKDIVNTCSRPFRKLCLQGKMEQAQNAVRE